MDCTLTLSVQSSLWAPQLGKHSQRVLENYSFHTRMILRIAALRHMLSSGL